MADDGTGEVSEETHGEVNERTVSVESAKERVRVKIVAKGVPSQLFRECREALRTTIWR